MPTRRRLWLLLLLYFAVLLAPSGSVSIIESTEARYAEIAREMIASGDYLEPRLNGIKHFHKPPLPYWMVAGGIRIFGPNNFGARFFGVAFACFAVLYLYRMARVLTGDGRRAYHAALVFATSILFLAVSRIASTEIYLVAFTVAAQFHLFRRICGERKFRDAPLFGLFLALGFLVKGHIVFAFTLLPLLAAKIPDPGHRSLFRPREILAGTAVFLAVGLPWYLLVSAKNPGLLPYFLKVHAVERIVTDRFHRYQPFYFFFYILAGTFLPYVFFLVRGMASYRSLPPRMKTLLACYIVLPFVVFSAVKGKHATYIAPLFGVLAVFTAESMAAFPAVRLKRFAAGLLALVAAAPAVAGFFFPVLRELRLPLIAVTVVALLMAWRAHESRADERFLPWTAGLLLFLATIGMEGAAPFMRETRAYETMTAAINRADPGRSLDILVYRGHLPSVSFYRGKLAAMAFGMPREVQFEADEAWRETYIDNPGALGRYLAARKDLFIVSPPGEMEPLLAEHPMACAAVFGTKRFTAYRCGRAEGDAHPPAAETDRPGAGRSR